MADIMNVIEMRMAVIFFLALESGNRGNGFLFLNISIR